MQRALILASNGIVDDSCIILDENALDDIYQSGADDGFVSPSINVLQENDDSQDCESIDDPVRNQKIPSDLGGELKQQEYQIILDALIECRGSRTDVAQRLGISPRTLRYKIAKMRELGMIIPS